MTSQLDYTNSLNFIEKICLVKAALLNRSSNQVYMQTVKDFRTAGAMLAMLGFLVTERPGPNSQKLTINLSKI